ncbi:MAG: YbgA family protein, partial [Thermodesulfobacteriota bacterium]
HKLDRFLTDTLGQYVEYIPACPEVECGLPVPRESMHLEGDPDSPRLITIRTKQDMTDRMVRWANKRVVALEKEDLCGFIFKSNSPSSGMERVWIYNEKGMPGKRGVGIFARIFMDHFPLLPVEDEGRLHDPKLRDNFIERIFGLKRWREILSKKESRGTLVEFHTKHKLLILSHGPKHYQMMGKLVAKAKEIPIKELYQQYQAILMEALQLKTSPKKNANVLQHMMGYFKEQLSSDEKQELLEVIDHYRKEYVPLIVPMTLINHYVRKYSQPYLEQQVYLNPHPLELRLRNHV